MKFIRALNTLTRIPERLVITGATTYISGLAIGLIFPQAVVPTYWIVGIITTYNQIKNEDVIYSWDNGSYEHKKIQHLKLRLDNIYYNIKRIQEENLATQEEIIAMQLAAEKATYALENSAISKKYGLLDIFTRIKT